jgi:hypothetical protein
LAWKHDNPKSLSDQSAHAGQRNEVTMADEAHAPSSFPVDAATPSEADYTAIHDVFMETARGRWFLAEFAKRNRNTDTRMVLDAVARIERSLAGAKDGPVDLTDALAAVRSIVEQAKQQANAALQGQPTADRFAVAYRSIRAIREIAWTLREYGTDAGICDGLDAQANTIDRSLDQLATNSPGESVAAIFDDLIQRLDELAGGELPLPQAAAPDFSAGNAPDLAALSHPTTTHGEASTFSEQHQPQRSMADAVSPSRPVMPPAPPITPSAMPEPAATAVAVADEGILPDTDADMVASLMDESAIAEADEAHDIAVLDMIAMEMGAPDPEAEDDALEDIDDVVAIDADLSANPESLDEAFDLRKDSPASLGAALIANGTIRPRSLTGTGRFAAIQRLSQVEKVALFS